MRSNGGIPPHPDQSQPLVYCFEAKEGASGNEMNTRENDHAYQAEPANLEREKIGRADRSQHEMSHLRHDLCHFQNSLKGIPASTHARW